MAANIFEMMSMAGRALSVQRTRMEVVSSNLANAHTTRSPEGGPYRKRNVILAEEVARRYMNVAGQEDPGAEASTVKLVEIVKDSSPPKLVYEPDHPDADASGYVAYPNINTVEEMVDLIAIMRSYQANLSSFSALREMAQSALTLGRNS